MDNLINLKVFKGSLMKYIWTIFLLLILTSCTIEMHEQNYKRILRKSADIPENVFLFEYFDHSFIKYDFPYLNTYYGSPYTYSGYIKNNNVDINKIVIKEIVIKYDADDGDINFKIINLLSNDFPVNDISIIERSLDRIDTDITDDLRKNNNITINNNEVSFKFRNININFNKVDQINVYWEIDIINKSNIIENIKFEEYYYKNYIIKKIARFTT